MVIYCAGWNDLWGIQEFLNRLLMMDVIFQDRSGRLAEHVER